MGDKGDFRLPKQCLLVKNNVNTSKFARNFNSFFKNQQTDSIKTANSEFKPEMELAELKEKGFRELSKNCFSKRTSFGLVMYELNGKKFRRMR